MTIPDDPPNIKTGIKKLELGYDLDKDHTGQAGGIPFTTAEGELLSNYMESDNDLSTKFPPSQ
jgi:hypothetical protein